MLITQRVFKHLGGDELLVILIERGVLLFHSNKEAFYDYAASKNGSLDHILTTLTTSCDILALLCRNNPESQK